MGWHCMDIPGSAQVKGIVHPKIKICWKFTYDQAIQDIDKFVSLSEQIWSNLAVHH